MGPRSERICSRRDFLRQATILASSGPFFLFPQRALAAQKKLRVLHWQHFVPGYDHWFEHTFAKEWGRQHDTRVSVDHVPLEELASHAKAEAAARKGHDVVTFLSPPAAYERDVIDHREIYRELRRHWGETIELAHKSTFNPRTRKYFAFSDSYIPAPFNWLKEAWTEAGLPLGPVDYETLRRVGAKIKNTRGIPCGFGLSAELDSNIALHSLLWSFGGMVQDQQGRVAINSRQTVEALKFMQAFYQEAETSEVLNWKSWSNDKALLAGRISCTMHAISISREAERNKKKDAGSIMLSPALRAYADPLAPPHVTQCYVIWNFVENKEGAQQFLVDLIGNSMPAFQASEFCNFPCFPKTVPDLLNQLFADSKAKPPGKYAVLRDTLTWTRNIGYPGYTTAEIDEVFSTFVIPRMFAQVARDELTAEQAAQAAEKEVEAIFSKWKQA